MDEITFTPEDENKPTQKIVLDKTDNIVAFPKSNIRRPPQSVEELRNNLRDDQMKVVIDLSMNIVYNIIQNLDDIGIDFETNPNANDIMFCVESLKSMIMRTYGLDHPLQLIAEEVLDIEDPNEIIGQFLGDLDLPSA